MATGCEGSVIAGVFDSLFYYIFFREEGYCKVRNEEGTLGIDACMYHVWDDSSKGVFEVIGFAGGMNCLWG